MRALSLTGLLFLFLGAGCGSDKSSSNQAQTPPVGDSAAKVKKVVSDDEATVSALKDL